MHTGPVLAVALGVMMATGSEQSDMTAPRGLTGLGMDSIDDRLTQAMLSFEQGGLEDAAILGREVLTVEPRNAAALHLLGVIAYGKTQYQTAVRMFRRACAVDRGNAFYQSNLGGALQAQGRLREAAVRYHRAIVLRPHFAQAYYNLGNVLRCQGKQSAAIEAYGQAIISKPDLHEAHTNLGNVLQSIGEWTAADACYERALAIKPGSAEAHSNRGNLRRAEGRLNAAILEYEEALSCDPDFADAYTNLGTVLQQQVKLESARACHEKAIALRPGFPEAHHNLGCVLQSMGETEWAAGCYDRAIELRPDYANAHFGKSLVSLLRCDYEAGWQGYEWRWQSDEHTTRWRDSQHPRWNGGRVSGRVFLWGEQGVGDEIFFAGLIRDAVETGNELVLACDARLMPLFARSFPQVEVVSARILEPPNVAAHLPTGSLPGMFRGNLAQFPPASPAYLVADPVVRENFRRKYADGRRLIGLAWRTANKRSGQRRSIDLSILAILFTRTDVRWISLQYGDHDDLMPEAAAAGAPILIDRSVRQFEDIETFAAQVSAMDLVVTIDNSTAHIAGALGVPVWTMLPFAPDWRWLESRPDSPWYPSMRIFRQPSLGDWRSIVSEVDRQLDVIAYERRQRVRSLPDERFSQGQQRPASPYSRH